MDVEATLAKHTVRRAIYVGPPLIAAMAVFRGVDGAVAATIGVAIVVANFLASGAMLSVAARISLAFYQAAALFGFFLRLALVTIAAFGIAALVDLDRPAFGITVVVSYLVLLSWEAVAISQGAERELEWSS